MGPNERMDLELSEDADVSSPPGIRKMHTFEHIGSLAAVVQHTPRRTRNRILLSIYIVLIKAKINVLLPFGPLAIILHYLTGKHVRLTCHLIYIIFEAFLALFSRQIPCICYNHICIYF